MKIIAFTKHNPKFEKYRPEEEDAFRYKVNGKIIIAVADGITRDPTGIETFPEFSDKKAMEESARHYPRLSPAKTAANLFCESLIEYSENKKINERLVKEALLFANEQIYEKLNRKLEVDYLENDFAACVGSAGIIDNNILYYGFVADCGVCVFDRFGKLRFKTKNEGPNKRIDDEVRKKHNTGFKYARGRKIIRSLYRNNPKEPLSYGAFTGEENVAEFVRTGQLKLEQGDKVIFYTDGMNNLLDQISGKFNGLEDFVDKNLDNINGAEATLVAILL